MCRSAAWPGPSGRKRSFSYAKCTRGGPIRLPEIRQTIGLYSDVMRDEMGKKVGMTGCHFDVVGSEGDAFSAQRQFETRSASARLSEKPSPYPCPHQSSWETADHHEDKLERPEVVIGRVNRAINDDSDHLSDRNSTAN